MNFSLSRGSSNLAHSQESTTTLYRSFIFSPSDRVKSYFSLLVTVLISIRICRELFFSQVLGVFIFISYVCLYVYTYVCIRHVAFLSKLRGDVGICSLLYSCLA